MAGRVRAGTCRAIAYSSGGSLVRTGTGTLILSAAHTFTGGRTVNQRMLVVNGNPASAVTLSGGSLGGNGTALGPHRFAFVVLR